MVGNVIDRGDDLTDLQGLFAEVEDGLSDMTHLVLQTQDAVFGPFRSIHPVIGQLEGVGGHFGDELCPLNGLFGRLADLFHRAGGFGYGSGLLVDRSGLFSGSRRDITGGPVDVALSPPASDW